MVNCECKFKRVNVTRFGYHSIVIWSICGFMHLFYYHVQPSFQEISEIISLHETCYFVFVCIANINSKKILYDLFY